MPIDRLPIPPQCQLRRKHEFVLGARNAPSAVSLDRRVSMRVCHCLVERQRSIRHRFHPLSEDDQTAHRARAFRPASARPLWERWGTGESDQSMGSPGRSGIAPRLSSSLSFLSPGAHHSPWGSSLASSALLWTLVSPSAAWVGTRIAAATAHAKTPRLCILFFSRATKRKSRGRWTRPIGRKEGVAQSGVVLCGETDIFRFCREKILKILLLHQQECALLSLPILSI